MFRDQINLPLTIIALIVILFFLLAIQHSVRKKRTTGGLLFLAAVLLAYAVGFVFVSLRVIARVTTSLTGNHFLLFLFIILVYEVVLAVYSVARNSTRLFRAHFKYQVLLVGALIMMLPFYWMVSSSFKTFSEAVAMPPTWFPHRLIWHNFVEAWNSTKSITYGEPLRPLTFGRYFHVSIVTGVTTTVATLITAALAAYAFAKMRFFGRGLFFYIVLATMMVPGQVLLIPNYILINRLGWYDTYLALIVPWCASVFVIFLMRQFFMTIPDDLWDAAQIDGSGRFRYLWMVIIPLSKPVFITSGIFTFLGNWNSLLWPLIMTTSPEMRTLMVGLQTFNQEAGQDFHLLMAASSLAIVPIVIIFFVLQRYFIQGIARTGLKD
jgi:multiple sugar transport system permease protein